MNVIQLLNINEDQFSDIKIHLASGSEGRNEAIKEFYKGTFKEWQEEQSKLNFERKYIFSVAQMSNSEWLFVGIYERIDVTKNGNDYKYQTVITDIGLEFLGKLIIRFDKTFRQSYVLAENYLSQFELLEIKRDRLTYDEFPGYGKVKIDYQTLRTIVQIEDRSWKTALSSITGIYLIADKNNGKLYVGSASGEMNFWQRWSDYATSFDGGNVELRKVKSENELSYLDNFQYSILEIFGGNTDINEILEREYFWQEILLTKEFGYNNGKKTR